MSESTPVQLPQTRLWANWKCLLICCVVSMANLEFGIDSGVVGSLQAIPGFLAVFGYPSEFIPGGYGLDSTFQQLITSLLILGGFLSSLVAGAFSVYFGRKTGLWVACVFTVVGVAIQMSTEDKGAIYVGRLVLGIGNGFLQTFSNIYCAEASPAHLRAILVGLSTEWILVGNIVAAVITNATQVRLDKASYQIPLGVLLILPFLLAVGLVFVPESPRYLVTKGRLDAAKRSLETLRGHSLQPEELELEYAEIVKGIEEEKRVAASLGPLDMFKGEQMVAFSADRRRTLLSMGTVTADSGGSGAWFLIPYVTYFMVISGVPTGDVFHYYVMNTCLGLVACNIGLFIMRHVCGRRSFLMLSAVFNGLFMLGLAVSSTVSTSRDTARTFLITFVSLFLIWYSFGTGVATRPVATELVSTRLRAWSFGAAQAVSQLTVWLVSFCTPYFINPEHLNWGGKYGYIFFGASLICLVWYYFFLPETKGRTLEEIDELFERKTPAWEFTKVRTTILDQAFLDNRDRHLNGEERDSSMVEK
ncbi:general substrate transporter [Thozetella sp. PMI_491]|nr:general substrate transporter [Thozetella sp. PMI_491]